MVAPCNSSNKIKMLQVDQMGNVFDFPIIPKRIISLVPSQTEYLCDIGLQDQIIGCTKFCIHPSNIKQRQVS